MKKIVNLIFLLISFCIGGCSSLPPVPEGIDSDVYYSWGRYSNRHEFNKEFSYREVYTKQIDDTLKANYRNHFISFKNENEVFNYYKNLIKPCIEILEQKGDFDTLDDIIKNNQDKLKETNLKLSKVIKYNYKYTDSFDDKRKFEFDYVNNLYRRIHQHLIWETVKASVSDLLKTNIYYNLTEEKYEIYVRFNQKNVYHHSDIKLMSNMLGVTVPVEESTFGGEGLSIVPSQVQIIVPMKKEIARQYPLEGLNVDLFFVLQNVEKKFRIETPTLSNTDVSNDFRTIYAVQVLGFDLKYKDKIIYSSDL